MLASSTHDTKRSEDVRARISLLSEIPDAWRDAVHRWAEMNAQYKSNGAPDRNTEYFLYQTMLGAWPIETDRLLPYIEKACREAKQQTSWLSPNKEFEDGTRNFIEAIYQDNRFRQEFEAFVSRLIEPGRINSLAQVLLKLTCPGVPDTYQGSELWDLSLVDPDNRRSVDYELRRRLLSQTQNLTVEQVCKRIDEGLPKIWTIWQTLRVRREQKAAFTEGGYTPLYPSGDKADHVVAYMRGEAVLVIVPRLVLTRGGDWGDTTLQIPKARWCDRLSNRTFEGGLVLLANALGSFPVALLVKE